MQEDDTKPPIPPTAPVKADEPVTTEAPEDGVIPQPTNADFIRQIIAKIASSENILVALSRNPSVDEIASAVGLALFLEESGKHITAIYSGETPNVLEFLKPEETFEDNTDSLQDFIIALNKEKADHLRYKVDGDYVKVFITPYKVKIDQDDLEFSHGDYNVDLVIALNVPTASDLDAALSEHGRIMHDASAIDITVGEPGRFGEIEWSDPESSSVGEMVANLLMAIKKPEIKPGVATALLAAMMAATNRFANEFTKSTTMTMAAKLMELGADQQLVAMNVMENSEPERIGAVDIAEAPSKKKVKDDKTLLTVEHENTELEDAIKEAAESVSNLETAEEKTTPDEIKSDAVAKAPVEPVVSIEAPAEAPVESPAEMMATEVMPSEAVPEVASEIAPIATPEVAPEVTSEGATEMPSETPVNSEAVMPEVVEPATTEPVAEIPAEPAPETASTELPPIESMPTEPESTGSASVESMIAGSAPVESTPAEPTVIPEEPKPEIESSIPPTPPSPPDYSQMMSEALAESIPGDAPAEPVPITSGPVVGSDDKKETNDGLESPEMASEPASLQDDSYVFNQAPKVIEPIVSEDVASESAEASGEALPDLPPPPIPPIDFGATPSDQPALPQTPETIVMPPADATAPATGALEQLQQMATPAQTVEAPTLPPVESVPGAIPSAEPATELTPETPPQAISETESVAPDAFQIPNL